MDLKSVYGCHTIPFTREVSDTDLFKPHLLEESRAAILRAIAKRSSAAIIGPSGSGKSTLVRVLIVSLPEARYATHYVKCTDFGKRDMCREIACACGVQPAGSFPSLMRRIQDKFEGTLSDSGRIPVLFLDEAHDLRPDVLGMLRIITNYQMDSRLVVSVVLAGQPALARILSRDDQDAVARRIIHYAKLRPLSREESANYVQYRMTIAGAKKSPFDAAALDAIYEIARGNLRQTDNLALESLELAAAAKLQVVGAQHISAARRALWPS